MSAATITQAHDKGLRHHFSTLLATVGDFAAQLYAAHGGWLAPMRDAAAARARQQGRDALLSQANQAETHSPSLAKELRNFASRG